MSTLSFPESIESQISRSGLVASVTIDHDEYAVPLARALLACGISTVEVSLNTDQALAAIDLIHREVPQCLVGAALVAGADQVNDAIDAGAQFGTSCGINEQAVMAAHKKNFPLIPGVMTPSELQQAVSIGCRHLHVFPVEPIGGLDYFHALVSTHAHLDCKFMVSGGLNCMHLRRYLGDSHVMAVLGDWIAPKRIIDNQNWSAVIDNATEAVSVLKEMQREDR